MEQKRRREYLIRYLLGESRGYRNSSVPSDGDAQKSLLRALMNIRPAGKIDKEFLTIQNEYLQRELLDKGITDINELMPLEGDIYLFKGDITTLRC